MTIVTIVGAGMMGTALCWPLSDNRHQVRLVGTPLDDAIIQSIRQSGIHPKHQRQVPAGVQAFFHGELPQAVQDAEVIVSGVSSFGVDWFGQTVGPYLKPEVPVIAVTKGLKDLPDGNLLTLPEATNSLLPADLQGRISLNAIGGPCIAQELAAQRHTGVVFCGRDQAVLDMLQKTFATPYYHVRTSTDLVGVEACAALKNAYAMGINLAVGQFDIAGKDGIAMMTNPQAALFAQALAEMSKLVAWMGGDPRQLYSLPGAGDLYVTTFGGRTARLGRYLGQGLSYAQARQELAGETLESVEIITVTARAVRKLIPRGVFTAGDFPLLLHMDEIIHQEKPVKIPWEQFFPTIP
jgi:glycerol-3-phosphate dehydrogenase (NAD(P)+)